MPPDTGAAPARPGPLDRLDAALVGGLGLAALGLSCLNVILRIVMPSAAIEWGDEVQVYLVVWAVCLSFAAVTAANRHIKADLLIDRMPPRLRAFALLFGDLLGLALSAALCWLGCLITYDTWDFGDVSTTTLRFPLWIYQAALPVGMALMALRYLLRLAARLGLWGGRP